LTLPGLELQRLARPARRFTHTLSNYDNRLTLEI
jgi:hypothetical protein